MLLFPKNFHKKKYILCDLNLTTTTSPSSLHDDSSNLQTSIFIFKKKSNHFPSQKDYFIWNILFFKLLLKKKPRYLSACAFPRIKHFIQLMKSFKMSNREYWKAM